MKVPNVHARRPRSPGVTRDLATGLGSVLFFAFTISALFIPLPPHEQLPEGATSDEATAYLARQKPYHDAQAGVHIVGLAFFVLFAWGLARRMHPMDAQRLGPANLTFAFGLAAVTYMLLPMGLVWAVDGLVGRVDGLVVAALYESAWITLFKVDLLSALFLGAAAAGILRTGALPRWLGRAAAGAAAVNAFAVVSPLLGPAAFVTFPAFMLLLAWSLIAGVVALVRPSAA